MNYNEWYKGARRSSSYSIGFSIFIIIICIVVYGIYIGRAWSKGTDIYEVTATVTDKGIKNYNKTSTYLVYTKTEDDEIAVFEITDSWVYGRFDSSDVYAGIEIGKTYTFTVGGQRNELMSWYPNIYEYEEVTE